jgi:hypothetical protein
MAAAERESVGREFMGRLTRKLKKKMSWQEQRKSGSELK